jgi:hypothetical protein
METIIIYPKAESGTPLIYMSPLAPYNFIKKREHLRLDNLAFCSHVEITDKHTPADRKQGQPSNFILSTGEATSVGNRGRLKSPPPA